ncbi:hypothetical protein CDAR_19431 [Caerostris darwini]|uniref:Uncharacterized protein n=1 Tax=Caerostris darwini TaxID=1538125 RepID=A0AAV4WEN3_9ARAC|nr:hypothetical protein CDAR_19431 [Caerostris darwini]
MMNEFLPDDRNKPLNNGALERGQPRRTEPKTRCNFFRFCWNIILGKDIDSALHIMFGILYCVSAASYFVIELWQPGAENGTPWPYSWIVFIVMMTCTFLGHLFNCSATLLTGLRKTRRWLCEVRVPSCDMVVDFCLPCLEIKGRHPSGSDVPPEEARVPSTSREEPPVIDLQQINQWKLQLQKGGPNLTEEIPLKPINFSKEA